MKTCLGESPTIEEAHGKLVKKMEEINMVKTVMKADESK